MMFRDQTGRLATNKPQQFRRLNMHKPMTDKYQPEVSSSCSTRNSFACLAVLTASTSLLAQSPPHTPTTQELMERIKAQDARIEKLNKSFQNAAEASLTQGSQDKPSLEAVYDKGFRLRSSDGSSPFELRVNGRMQMRYVGFASDETNPPNPNRSDFDIERARLEFAGTFFDENTHFYINLDADTDDNHSVVFHDFWVNYDVAENHSIYVGKAFFPGTRDWISGSTRTHFIDRSLATTFFRPDRTVGVWAIGKMSEDVNYRVMVGNGLKTTDLKYNEIDDKFAYAASLWIDPFAAYGKGYADISYHEELAMRIGTTFSYTEQEDGQGNARPEAASVRLSDGTKLTDRGADQYNYHMGAFDIAMKYQGFSANSEMFYRYIDEIEGPLTPSTNSSYYDWGGYCDMGYMIVPGKLEPVIRFSTVQGSIKDTWEYAGGVNYYVDGTHKNKLSIDLSKFDGSPTSNSGPNYRVGDDGWLFRIQWQIAF
jgi:hypothetical protein